MTEPLRLTPRHQIVEAMPWTGTEENRKEVGTWVFGWLKEWGYRRAWSFQDVDQLPKANPLTLLITQIGTVNMHPGYWLMTDPVRRRFVAVEAQTLEVGWEHANAPHERVIQREPGDLT